jgi:WD40 repeat protein
MRLITTIGSIVVISIITIAQDISLQDMLTHPSCTQWCWLNIEPGVTSTLQMEAILDANGLKYLKTENPMGFEVFYNVYWGLENPDFAFPFAKDFDVTIIEINRVTNRVVSVRTNVFDVSLQEVLQQIENPPGTIVYYIGNPIVVFRDEGFIIEISDLDNSEVISLALLELDTIDRFLANRAAHQPLQPCIEPEILCGIELATENDLQSVFIDLPDVIAVRGIASSPDSSLLAVAGSFASARGIRIFDGEGHEQIFIETSGSPVSLSWSPDGEKLISSVVHSNTNEYQVFEISSGQLLSSVPHGPLESFDVAWSRDSSLYAVPTSIPGSGITIINTSTGTVMQQFEYDRSFYGNSVELEWYEDTLFLVSSNGTVTVWDVASGLSTEIVSLSGKAHSLQLSPDNELLAISLDSGQIAIVDTESLNLENMLEPLGAEEFNFYYIWSADSQKIVTFVFINGEQNSIRVWNVDTQAMELSLSYPRIVHYGNLAWFQDKPVFFDKNVVKMIDYQ